MDLKNLLYGMRLASVRDTNRPPAEFRLHPEDFDELRAACSEPWQLYPTQDLRAPEFCGVKVVVDAGAPRLPRAQSTPQPPAPPADHS